MSAMVETLVEVGSTASRSAIEIVLYADDQAVAVATISPQEMMGSGREKTATIRLTVRLGEGEHVLTACAHQGDFEDRESRATCTEAAVVQVSCEPEDPCAGEGLPPNAVANGNFEAGLTGWVTQACAGAVEDDAVHCTALNLTACFYASSAWQVVEVDVDSAQSVRLRLDAKLMTFYGSYSGPLIARVYTGGPPSYDALLVGTHVFLPGEPAGTDALEGTSTQPLGVWASWTSEDLRPLLPPGTRHLRIELRDAASYGSWEGAGRFDNVRIVVDDETTPVATATATPTSGHPPLEVQLDGACVDADGDCRGRWWDFGNGPSDQAVAGGGDTSLQASPVHRFAAEGDYWVAFTVQDEDGAASTTFTAITVANLAPAVSIVANPASGPAPLSASFEALVVDDDDTHTYTWSFGDGESSSAASPSHTYDAPGTYDVSVTVTDPLGASGTARFAVVATGERPIANGDFADDLSGWVSQGCAWSTNDDAVHGTALNLTACYYRSHAWQVAAVDTGAYDSVRLRLDVKLMTFNNWYSGPMVVRVFAGGPPSYDQTLVGTHRFVPGDLEDSALLEGTTRLPMAVWYAWTSEDLTPLLPTDTQHLRIELWDTIDGQEGGGRFDNVTLVLDDASVPQASATATPANGHPPLEVWFEGACVDADGSCAGQWWDFGNGPIANGTTGGGDASFEASTTYVIADESERLVSFTVEDLEGAASTTFIMVTAFNETPSVAIVASPAVGVAPLTASFEAVVTDDDDAHAYAWDFGDGASSSEANPTHVFASPGTYHVAVSVTDPLGATASASYAVVVTGDEAIANGDFTDGLTGWVTEACASPNEDDAVHGTALNLTACFYRSHAWQVAAVDVDASGGVRLRLDVKLMTFNGGYTGPMVARVYTGVAPSYDGFLVGTHRFVPGILHETDALEGTTQLPMAVWYAWTSEDLTPLMPAGTENVRVELWDTVDGWEGGGRFDNVRLVLGDGAVPVASIDAAPTYGPAPLEVALSGGCSGDCAAQWWDLGDGPIANGTVGGGTTSTDPTLSATFTGDRSYTVTFTVEAPFGAASTAVQTVSSVHPPPEVSIAPTPDSGPAPLVVQFAADVAVTAGGSVVGYLWNFGDGVLSSEANPTHVYTDAGTFFVTLRVTDDQGATSSAGYSIVVTAQ